jgi:hypothetical protein
MNIQNTLADISETMSDGYKFIKVLQLCNQMEDLAEDGDESAAEILQIVVRFNNLINYANANKI